MPVPEFPNDRLGQILRRELGRRQRLTAALVLASCAVIVVNAVTWRDRQRLQRTTAELAACERSCQLTDPAVPAAFFSPARTLATPLDPGPRVLDVPLEVVCPTGEIVDTTLGRATVPGAVHLVNLWQLSCAGCKREFPLLRRALASADAGRLRFLPVDDSNIGHPAEDYRTARTRHAMPTPSVALVDRDLAGARLLPALQGLAADTPPLAGGPPLVYPLSFVLDCDERMRWWKVGSIDETEADALTDLLTTLVDAPTCRADPPAPPVCNDPRPPRSPHRDRDRKPDPKPDPAIDPTDAAATPPPPPEPEPSPPPEPAPAPDPIPAPAPAIPASFPALAACQSACPRPRTCQAAAHGRFTCSAPPPPL